MSDEFEIPIKKPKPHKGNTTPPAKGGVRASNLRKRDEDGLTPMQRLFVEEYLTTLNGSLSARNVGVKPESAGQQALDWLKDDRVWAAVEKGMAKRITRLRRKQDAVIKELWLILKSDVTHYVRGQANRLEVVAGVDPRVTRAVSRVKFKDRYYTDKDGQEHAEHEMELALWDKNSAAARLMRHLGIEYGDGRTNNCGPNMKPGGAAADEDDGQGDTLVITEVAE